MDFTIAKWLLSKKKGWSKRFPVLTFVMPGGHKTRPGGRRRGSEPCLSHQRTHPAPAALIAANLSIEQLRCSASSSHVTVRSSHLSHTHSTPRSTGAFIGARKIKQTLFVFSLSLLVSLATASFLNRICFQLGLSSSWEHELHFSDGFGMLCFCVSFCLSFCEFWDF